MPFETFNRPVTTHGRVSKPAIGVDKNGFITISTAAHQMLGEPAAVTVEWDPDEYLIRLTGAAPTDRNAFKTGGKNRVKRFAAQAFLSYAGLSIPEKGMSFPAKKQGLRSIVADLSGLPAPKKPS